MGPGKVVPATVNAWLHGYAIRIVVLVVVGGTTNDMHTMKENDMQKSGKQTICIRGQSVTTEMWKANDMHVPNR